MKILLDLQNSMRAVTLNSEFSLCGLNLIKVKFLGGEAREFGGEASPLSSPLDETL